jgi:hypothetical protein
MRLFSICGALGVCATLALIVGCGGAQVPTSPVGSISQNAAQAPQSVRALQAAPNVVTKCPEPNKLYTTGTSNGHVVSATIVFPIFDLKDHYIRNAFRYDDWPKNRAILLYKPELLTCGAQAGKKPLGEISQSGSHQYYPPKCDPKTLRCSYFYETYFKYRATMKPPGPRSWKYDYVRIVPEKPTKGYAALPLVLIEVFH